MLYLLCTTKGDFKDRAAQKKAVQHNNRKYLPSVVTKNLKSKHLVKKSVILVLSVLDTLENVTYFPIEKTHSLLCHLTLLGSVISLVKRDHSRIRHDWELWCQIQVLWLATVMLGSRLWKFKTHAIIYFQKFQNELADSLWVKSDQPRLFASQFKTLPAFWLMFMSVHKIWLFHEDFLVEQCDFRKQKCSLQRKYFSFH